MSPIKCPKCSNEMPDAVAACPKCGHMPGKATGDQEEIVRIIKEMLARNEKIQAIKYYRECVPGADLKSSKEAVERIERGEAVSLPANANAASPDKMAKQGGCASVIIFGVLLGGGVIWTMVKLWG